MKYGLSKSRYCSGVQCPKMLWLKKNVPDAFDPRVAPAVAAAVAKVAIEKGLARKIVDPEEVKANTMKRVGR